MQLTELIEQKVVVEKLSILSFEMNIYLVSITSNRYEGLVRKEDGLPQRFKSVEEVKNAFIDCDVKFAELVHESPYDEMIGNPPKSTDKMVLPIKIH